MLQFRSIKFFYCGIECIAIDVDNGLGEVPRQLKLCNVLIGSSEV